jgi:hypothetical protein
MPLQARKNALHKNGIPRWLTIPESMVRLLLHLGHPDVEEERGLKGRQRIWLTCLGSGSRKAVTKVTSNRMTSARRPEKNSPFRLVPATRLPKLSRQDG